MAGDQWVDLPTKLAALTEVGVRHGLTTLVLRDPASLTWLLGARVNVPQTLDSACLDVIVDLTGDVARMTVVTNAIEAPRLRETELAGIDADWVVVPWWEGRDPQLPTGSGVGSDRATGQSVAVGPDLASLRRRLTPHQQDVLREVCHDTADAAAHAVQRLSPTTTEYAAAGLLADELLVRGLDPIVLMVAGDARIAGHRHPLPTGARLGRRAMLVACGRRHGLVASVTRIASFQPLPDSSRETYERLLRVEQAFLDATQVGACVGEVVATGADAYRQNGFDPDEWHRHHQGGFTGFQPREFPAHRGSTQLIEDGSVVAWNPSGAGWKVEDTCLVRGAGVQPLVTDGVWPTTNVGGRDRPDVLEL